MAMKNENMETRKSPEVSHEKVSPTARGIAYRRAICDIPFAKDVYDELAKVMTPEEKEQMIALTSEKDQALTPQFEARYKLLNRFLKESGSKQVLELAAGIAPRGIEMTQDPEMTYVEVDLPGIVKQKKEIIESLEQQSKIQSHKNLELVEGSALDSDVLAEATANFDEAKPITVIHEGLMRYLNFKEKAQVAENVRGLLRKFGGVYITPDITLKVFVDDRVKNVVSKMIGMDINANAFESVEQAEQFFGDLGFEIEKHSFTEARNELVSPERLNLSEEQVDAALRDPVFFVMKLKANQK
jgi:O-methyltransferase involved in polyketide biosynthesis